MDKFKKLIVLLLVVAVGSLGLIGCKNKEDHPTGEDQPSTETAPEETTPGETPAPDHPKGEHPK